MPPTIIVSRQRAGDTMKASPLRASARSPVEMKSVLRIQRTRWFKYSRNSATFSCICWLTNSNSFKSWR